jgi:hypothetical protein
LLQLVAVIDRSAEDAGFSTVWHAIGSERARRQIEPKADPPLAKEQRW